VRVSYLANDGWLAEIEDRIKVGHKEHLEHKEFLFLIFGSFVILSGKPL
jgi:nitrate reductase NapE component